VSTCYQRSNTSTPVGVLTDSGEGLIVRWILLLAVVVRTLRWFANAIEAVDLHVGCQRKSALKWIHPLRGNQHDIINLLFAMCNALAVTALGRVLVPVLGLGEEVRYRATDSQVSRRQGSIRLLPVDELSIGDVLARLVIGRSVLITPDSISTDG
jgi:hypothetical protein